MKVEKELGNLMINGYGSANGGEFDSVIINGKGTVNSDLNCSSFTCNGAGTVNGDVKSDCLRISGTGKIAGKVYASDLMIEGNGSIMGDVLIDKMTISGKGSVGGNVKGEEMKIQGKVSIGGNCEVENFRSEGQFTIGGLLSAEEIYIETYGECKAKEIGGETIRVKQKTNLLLDLIKTIKSVKLEADLIEGDHITLENTKAKVVRGKHILIGENCEIDLVEYKDTFKVEKNGRVKESVQI